MELNLKIINLRFEENLLLGDHAPRHIYLLLFIQGEKPIIKRIVHQILLKLLGKMLSDGWSRLHTDRAINMITGFVIVGGVLRNHLKGMDLGL